MAEFPGYEVSDAGRVRNAATGQILPPSIFKGYARVHLRGVTRRISRLVCSAWHGEPPFPDAQAAHLDGNKGNNVPQNLAWVTCAENNSHKLAHGTNNHGERNGRAKFREVDVIDIRRRVTNGERAASIAKKYGVTRQYIYLITSGKRWNYLSKGAGARV